MAFTTISSWALVIARALQSYGCDSDAVFREVGLDPDTLRDPNARYPTALIQRLWARAGAVSDDPCFALSAARFWHPTTFHALGYAWMASSSLHDALLRLVRYIRIVTTAAEATLEEQSDVFTLALEPSDQLRHSGVREDTQFTPNMEGVDAGMATIVQMCRAVCGDAFRPAQVSFTRDRPECAQRFESYFAAPVLFSAPRNALEFARDDVLRALPTAHAELALANEKVVAQYLAQLDRDDIEMQVRVRLVNMLPSGDVSEQAIADALHMSLRSLQRKLSERGASYKTLLDDTRRELARQYLDNSYHSVNEVTYLLGFSEPSNFTRAFKRWYGKSPTAYRSRGLN